MDYYEIEKEAKNILYKNNNILNQIKELEKEYNNNIKKLDIIFNKYPKCHSCHKNKNPKYMWIASEDDIKNYIDQNEGYNGPIINEYYCGC